MFDAACSDTEVYQPIEKEENCSDRVLFIQSTDLVQTA